MNNFAEPSTLKHRDQLVKHVCGELKTTVATGFSPEWRRDIRVMFQAVEQMRSDPTGVAAEQSRATGRAADISCSSKPGEQGAQIAGEIDRSKGTSGSQRPAERNDAKNSFVKASFNTSQIHHFCREKLFSSCHCLHNPSELFTQALEFENPRKQDPCYLAHNA